jgi:hypothetical protein
MATPFTGHDLEGKYYKLKENEIKNQIDIDLKKQIKYINDATSNVPYTIVASNIYLLKDKFSLDGQILTDLIYSNITDETKITPLIDAINEKIRRSNEFRQEEEDKEPELPTSRSRSNSGATTTGSTSSDSTPTTSSKPPERKGLLGFGKFGLGGKSKKSRKSRKSKRSRKTRRGRK